MKMPSTIIKSFPYKIMYYLHWFSLSLFPLLGSLGRFPLLSNFHSLLGFAFAVKSKAEKW